MSRREPVPPEVVAVIRRLRAEGLSLAEVARRTGQAKSSVHWLLKRDARQDSSQKPAEPAPAVLPAGRQPSPMPIWPVERFGPQAVPPSMRGPYPLRDDEPRDHPAALGLIGWVRVVPGLPIW